MRARGRFYVYAVYNHNGNNIYPEALYKYGYYPRIIYENKR